MQVVGLGDNVFDVWEGSGLGYPGGNAVNVSVSAARLGCDAAYVGAIADDKWGRAILATLRAEDVDTSACQAVAGASTKRCIEVPDGPGHRWVRNELGDAWPGYRPLTDRQLAKTNAADAILTSCNAKCVSDLPRLAGRAGVLSFDFGEKPAYRTPEYLGAVAPYIDLAQFSCSGISEDEAARLYTSSGLECPVLITRASCAPLLFSGDGCVRGRAAEGSVRDTLGAGDSFVTALVIALLRRGWGRGKALPATEVCEGALLEAADHAARMCQLPGAFGHGLVFERPAAVVFDNDGVIVDSEPLYGRITQEFVRSHGAELSAEDLGSLRGASEKDQLQIIAPYIGCTTEEARDLSTRAFDEYFARNPLNFADIEMPGVRDLIWWLHGQGIPLALASSSSMRDLEQVIDQCGLGGAFDAVVSGHDMPESKPNPAIYLEVFAQLGVDAAHSIVIEDSKYGVEAGLRAGAQVLALRTPEAPVDLTEASLAFDNHAQILRHLRDRLC